MSPPTWVKPFSWMTMAPMYDGQERLWVEIPLFGSPYSSDDDGLQIAAERLTDRIIELQSASDLGHMIADHG